MQLRVGLGAKRYRVKQRGEQKNRCWIGGVELPNSKFVYEHNASDDTSDVIQLAIADALFGATALGDGSIVFNKEKAQIPLKGNPKKEAPRILARTYNFIRKNWIINNIDITLEMPLNQKIEDTKNAIVDFICTALRIQELSVNLKVCDSMDDSMVSCMALVSVQRQKTK